MSSSGPFAATSRRLTCPSVPVFSSSSPHRSPDRVSTLSGPGTCVPYPASYPGRPAEEPAILSRFPAAFRLPAFASRSSDSRWGIGPSLRSAYRPMAGPRRGYHVPHARAATGVGAPSTPRTAVLSRLKSSPWPAPAASQRPVLAPRSNIPSNEVPLHEASTGVQAIHPSGLPLACSPPMEREPLGSPPSFEPHRLITGDARRGGDRPRARARNYTLNITSVDPPIRVVHSYACDLVSHDDMRSSAVAPRPRTRSVRSECVRRANTRANF